MDPHSASPSRRTREPHDSKFFQKTKCRKQKQQNKKPRWYAWLSAFRAAYFSLYPACFAALLAFPSSTNRLANFCCFTVKSTHLTTFPRNLGNKKAPAYVDAFLL